uniref:Taste receptor type 2 n=1 Tax=Pyxicephalus adspersus TaxID=30357 RepID=A0AAV2ZY27_PYXAD|nr:TPA: hypothetical protein GDO54_004180 [Pyxicephalus adspersus]
MSQTLIMGITAAQIVTCFFGFITNGFILGVNFQDWIRSIPLTTSDFYMSFMALINIFLQIWTAADWMCDQSEDQSREYFCKIVYACKMMTSSSSLLLTASLCLFYCSKIVVLKSHLLRWSQNHITSYYRPITAAILLLCILMALPLAWIGDDEEDRACKGFLVPCNQTRTSYMIRYRPVLIVFGYTLPVTCVLLSAFLILRSLIKHMKKMRVTIRVRMEAHVQAGYTVLLLLILFCIYFVLSLLLLIKMAPKGSIIYYTCYTTPLVYSLIHSLVLIKGHAKLRQTVAGFMKKLLWCKG